MPSGIHRRAAVDRATDAADAQSPTGLPLDLDVIADPGVRGEILYRAKSRKPRPNAR